MLPREKEMEHLLLKLEISRESSNVNMTVNPRWRNYLRLGEGRGEGRHHVCTQEIAAIFAKEIEREQPMLF